TAFLSGSRLVVLAADTITSYSLHPKTSRWTLSWSMDPAEGTTITSFAGNAIGLLAVAFSDGTVCVLIPNGDEQMKTRVDTRIPLRLTWTSDGRRLVVCGSRGLTVLSLSGAHVAEISMSAEPGSSVSYVDAVPQDRAEDSVLPCLVVGTGDSIVLTSLTGDTVSECLDEGYTNIHSRWSPTGDYLALYERHSDTLPVPVVAEAPAAPSGRSSLGATVSTLSPILEGEGEGEGWEGESEYDLSPHARHLDVLSPLGTTLCKYEVDAPISEVCWLADGDRLLVGVGSSLLLLSLHGTLRDGLAMLPDGVIMYPLPPSLSHEASAPLLAWSPNIGETRSIHVHRPITHTAVARDMLICTQ
ncbi:hypothetical protein KIPB_010353, partial [Kipferlia bialata]